VKTASLPQAQVATWKVYFLGWSHALLMCNIYPVVTYAPDWAL